MEPGDAHAPVLLDAVCEALLPQGQAARIVDGTLGAGGHSRALLERGAEQLLGLDLDPQAIALAQVALAPFGERAHIVNDSYVNMAQHAHELGWDQVDGIVLDLGVSSMQLDTPERGFAFRHEGPLDMRFNPARGGLTAASIVNTWDVEDLAQLFADYGEEREAKRIARAVVVSRPYQSTQQLAGVIAAGMSHRERESRRIHPATRIFQALRLAVNEELQAVALVLPVALDLLAPGGRLAVISFHSLEDRIVKQFFKEASTEIESPPGMASIEARPASMKLITRKPMVADEVEQARNPRSRSAKLRVAEKLAQP